MFEWLLSLMVRVLLGVVWFYMCRGWLCCNIMCLLKILVSCILVWVEVVSRVRMMGREVFFIGFVVMLDGWVISFGVLVVLCCEVLILRFCFSVVC